MTCVVGNTPSEAYLSALRLVVDRPEFICAPRGQKIHEILNFSLEVADPRARGCEPLVTLDEARNKVLADYTAKEFALYISGNDRAEDWAKASKFWLGIANPDSSVNSAYGRLIFYDKSCGNPEFELWHKPEAEKKASVMRTPWEWAVHSLTTDKDTRQAVVPYLRRDHLWVGCRDVTCTLAMNFHVREDRLFSSTTMRSNDGVKGMGFDLPWFIFLANKMLEDLKPAYPDLKLGTYTHIAHSFHIYERDLQTARLMVGDQTIRKP